MRSAAGGLHTPVAVPSANRALTWWRFLKLWKVKSDLSSARDARNGVWGG